MQGEAFSLYITDVFLRVRVCVCKCTGVYGLSVEPVFRFYLFIFFLSVLCSGRALTFVCVFVHFPCVRRCVHDNFPKTRRLRFHSLMLPPHPSTTSISEGQKEITRVLMSFFFWGGCSWYRRRVKLPLGSLSYLWKGSKLLLKLCQICGIGRRNV